MQCPWTTDLISQGRQMQPQQLNPVIPAVLERCLTSPTNADERSRRPDRRMIQVPFANLLSLAGVQGSFGQARWTRILPAVRLAYAAFRFRVSGVQREIYAPEAGSTR